MFNRLPRGNTAGFTSSSIGGYGLLSHWPTKVWTHLKGKVIYIRTRRGNRSVASWIRCLNVPSGAFPPTC